MLGFPDAAPFHFTGVSRRGILLGNIMIGGRDNDMLNLSGSHAADNIPSDA
jgi:hypothetical protein